MPAAPIPLRFSETARSGSRMLMAMPVTLEGVDLAGKAYKEATQTVVINRNGCKVLTSTPLTINDKLTLSVGTKRVTEAVVVWVGDKKGAKTEVGLDIAQNDGMFWGVLFPDDSGTFPPGSFSSPVVTKAPSAPAPALPTAAVSPTAKPASTPPAHAPESVAPSPAPRTPGVQSSPADIAATAADFLRGKEELDRHVQVVLTKAQLEISDKVKAAMAQSMKEGFESALKAAKSELERITGAHSQLAQKGIEGIQKAAERTTMAIEQRALNSALNTQTTMEMRFQARLADAEKAINGVIQQAAEQLEQRVQEQIRQIEDRWKKKLDEFVEERIEGHLSAQQAQLLTRSQELMESQMQEFEERLRNSADQMIQNVTKKHPIHKSDKSNIV